MKTGWELLGRSWVLWLGSLSVSIRARGSKARGDLQWRVDDVFGNQHLGGDWHEDPESAMEEAELIAVRALAELNTAWRMWAAFGSRRAKGKATR